MVILRKLKLFLYLFFIELAVLFLTKIIFFLYYFDIFGRNKISDIILSLKTGIRFDISTGAMMLIPFVLLLGLPYVSKFKRFLKIVFYAFIPYILLQILYLITDMLYFEYTKRHFTYEVIEYFHDIFAILKTGIFQYGLELVILSIFCIFIGFLLFKLMKKINTRIYTGKWNSGFFAIPQDIIVLILYVFIIIVAIRGGFQNYPLSIKDAYVSSRSDLVVLSLNGLYTGFSSIYGSFTENKTLSIARALKRQKRLRKLNYNNILKYIIDTKKESLNKEYPLYRRYNYKKEVRKEMNVVILLMESWSGVFAGRHKEATPFFSKLSEKGLYCDNFFASAQRSKIGISSIIASVPPRSGMDTMSNGLFFRTKLITAVDIFKNLGYETWFVHGEKRERLGFGRIIRRLGFQHHIALEDFDMKPGMYDGVWGIYDEYGFKKANEIFSKSKTPFFGMFFTVTSHSPYHLPSAKYNYFKSNVPNYKFLNTLRYSDQALEEFFKLAKKSEYYNNTLFIIVADHTEGHGSHGNLYTTYKIPCLFYSPKQGLMPHAVLDAPGTQVDILPTIIDILQISKPFTSFGKSLLCMDNMRRGILPRGERYAFYSDRYVILADTDHIYKIIDYKKDPEINLLMNKEKDTDIEPTAERLYSESLEYLSLLYQLFYKNQFMPLSSK